MTQPDTKTSEFNSGAVRSADAGHLSFTSLPLVGLIGVAKTAAEGAEKYGRHNYSLGMPAHDLLDHVFRHLVMWTLGDRSEPHLEHAAWGLLATIQEVTLNPYDHECHLLGPGATVTDDMREYLRVQSGELKSRREKGEFAGSGQWRLSDVPEVNRLLQQRNEVNMPF